jgi:hypothetical protein
MRRIGAIALVLWAGLAFAIAAQAKPKHQSLKYRARYTRDTVSISRRVHGRWKLVTTSGQTVDSGASARHGAGASLSAAERRGLTVAVHCSRACLVTRFTATDAAGDRHNVTRIVRLG